MHRYNELCFWCDKLLKGLHANDPAEGTGGLVEDDEPRMNGYVF